MGLDFLLEKPKFRVRDKHRMGKTKGSGQNGYASEWASTVHISQLKAIWVPGILKMELNPFLEQGGPEMEDIWQNVCGSRVPGTRTSISQKSYASKMNRDSSWERGHPTVKLGEGFGQAGFIAGFSQPVLSRSLTASKFRPSTVVQLALFLLAAAGCAGATWEDFANNLGSDVAPLLALLGEQVTRQYLSESYSLLDSFVFALAPLGIITGIVAAIRVGGNSKFRSLIGRATEGRGTVEADLMSSTSADVCELWNGQGIVRVLGSPVLLQLVCVASQNSGAKAGIYTLPEAISDRHYGNPSLSERNPDTEAFLAHQNPPSLSLNASINIKRRRSIAKVIAPVGVLLQSGVLVFAGLVQYKPGILRGSNPIAYGFPMFLAGTLSLTIGMFLCAQVVELSTKETVYEPSKELIAGTKDRNTIIWLQQGGQIVGDQLFESFARRRPAATIMTSEKSETDRNTLVVIAVTTSLFGFIAQFVGLRAMHATVTVIQLGIVLIMTALRSFAHMQREHRNDIKNPRQVDGHELDWLAKELNGCESWEVVTQFDKPLSAEESSNLAMDVVKSRARLAALSEGWTLESRNKIKVLQSVIEESINHVFARMVVKDDSKKEAEFQWHFPVKVKFGEEESIFPITLSLRREKDDSGSWKGWNADVSELEAVLCLWASSLTEAERKRAQGGMPALKYIRLLGPATDESKIDYRIWIYRETPYNEAPGPLAIPTPATSDEARYFGWTKDSKDANRSTATKSICVDYKGGLENLCVQDLYGWFIFNLVSVIQRVGGSTTPHSASEEPAAAVSGVQSERWDNFRLINSDLNLLATFFSESGLGTIEEAYFYLVPAFRLAGSLPFPHEAYDRSRAETERLENNGLWEQALGIDWWLYHNSRKTGANGLDTLLPTVRIKKFLRRLAEKLSLESSEEDSDGNLARIWDAVYSGWGILSEASEDRVASLLKLSITCSKIKPEMDQKQVFLLALDTAQNLDIRVLRTADVVLDLARFCLGNGLLDDAEALAKRVWVETIEPWHGREKTRNKAAGKLLLNIYQHKGTSLIHDEYKFSAYLSDPESMQLTARTDIYTTVSTSDITQGQIPIELLVIRGSKTPLQWAAENGQENIVRKLLKSGVASNETPAIDSGRTALQAAAGGGHEGTVKLLLEAKAEVNARPAESGGRSALQAAAEGGHEGIVKLLLEAKAEVNVAPAKSYGRTALQAAAERGHEGTVKLLLESKAEVNAAPAMSYGRTALQAAAEGGHEGTVKLLLEAKAEVNAAPAMSYGRTALQAAAEGGHEGTVKLLLEAKAEVNAAPASEFGRTALQAAAGKGHESIVKVLLEAKAEVNAAPKYSGGRTALQAAAGGGREGIVKLLLESKAEVNAAPAMSYGRTALQAAAEGGHEGTVKLLLETKAEVNAAPGERDGRTALQAAAGEGHEGIVKLFLEAKAEVNAAPAMSHGRTALQAAAEGGHEGTVKLLLEAKAEVNVAPASEFGRTALQAAAGKGHESIVKLLLEAKAEVNAAPAKRHGRMALQAAADGGRESIVKLLLEAKARVNIGPSLYGGRTALQAAAGGGREGIVKLLLEAKAEVNTAPAMSHGRTALQAAAEGGHEGTVKLLLEAKAEVNAAPASEFGRTALQAAAGKGHESIVKVLLEATAEVNAAPGFTGGRTALQAAAERGREGIVKLLLESKAEVNAAPATSYGRTALQAAAEGGHEGTVKLLLEAKARVNIRPSLYGGRTALQAAAGESHESIVKVLLEAKAEVNAAPGERDGRTALQAAAEGGHESIVKLLLKSKAEVNAAAGERDGRTALQAAAGEGHEGIVKLLLEAKAEVNAAPAMSHGRTALQAAAEGGHESIVKLLLESKAEVNAAPATSHGRTALQAAAEGGHESIVKLLFKANTKATDNGIHASRGT